MIEDFSIQQTRPKNWGEYAAAAAVGDEFWVPQREVRAVWMRFQAVQLGIFNEIEQHRTTI